MYNFKRSLAAVQKDIDWGLRCPWKSKSSSVNNDIIWGKHI